MRPLHATNDCGTAAPARECILCGRCLEVCPLVSATGREELSPKAKHTLAQVLRQDPARLQGKRVADLAGLCLACGRCEKACPQGLCAPDAVAALRKAHPDLTQWLWKQWIEKGGALWPALAWLSRRLPEGGEEPAPRYDAFKTMGAGPALEPFLRVSKFVDAGMGRKAAIFPGCTARRLFPEWTRRAAELLAGLGFGAPEKTPAWACCGCTLGHAGCEEAQREAQLTNVLAWRKAGRPLMVTFCATCRCGLRSYPEADLGWEQGEAEQWRKAVVSLASPMAGTEVVAVSEPPSAVYYHKPCHGSGQAGAGADEALLARALGARYAGTTGDVCCGMGGIMQLGAPALSRKVADSLWTRLDPPSGSLVLTGCSGCVLHLKATAPSGVAVGHWLETFVPNAG
ncbi:MAG: (Fe-S)-binding protein [Oceanidesulfovibrio sp.]